MGQRRACRRAVAFVRVRAVKTIVDQYGGETTSTDDANGKTIRTVNADGTETFMMYDALTTRTVYDQLGQVTETQQYAGELIVDVTPGGVPTGGTRTSSTFTCYDAAGNAIETIGANGLRTGTIYNPDGSVEYTGPLNASAPGRSRTLPKS